MRDGSSIPGLMVTLVLALVACAPSARPDRRAEDEAALRRTDLAFAGAAEAGDLDAMLAFYADDAVTQPPHARALNGKSAIRSGFEPMLSTPGLKLSWAPTRVEVALSGDLGYTIGEATMTVTGPDGVPAPEPWKYTTVWRKGPDGTWKVIVDAFNPDVAAPE